MMTFEEFSNGLRVLWNINKADYLACINDEDREHYGDGALWARFATDAHKTFAGLPTQDQMRVFAIITRRNEAMRKVAPAVMDLIVAAVAATPVPQPDEPFEETHCGYTVHQVVERAMGTDDTFDGMEMLRMWWNSIQPGSDNDKQFQEWMRGE